MDMDRFPAGTEFFAHRPASPLHDGPPAGPDHEAEFRRQSARLERLTRVLDLLWDRVPSEAGPIDIAACRSAADGIEALLIPALPFLRQHPDPAVRRFAREHH